MHENVWNCFGRSRRRSPRVPGKYQSSKYVQNTDKRRSMHWLVCAARKTPISIYKTQTKGDKWLTCMCSRKTPIYKSQTKGVQCNTMCCRNTQSPAACWSAEPGLKKILCPYFPNEPFILWLVDILSNISLISPLSGDWWIYFQGDAGEVRLHCVLLPNHAGGVRQGNSSRGSCWILKN